LAAVAWVATLSCIKKDKLLMPSPIRIFATADDVEHAFYDAIARADLESLMALWADDDEISCVHPGAPRLQGHAAIRESWEMIFERGPVHIRPRHLHVNQNMSSAVHSLIEEVKTPDDPDWQQAHIVATNVYLKTPQGWRMVVHHASIAPGVPADEQASGSGVLH
jgi:ketosteroid isomerase-like protein